MFAKENWLKGLCLGLLLTLGNGSSFSVLPGTLIVDEQNYWGHNGKLANASSKAAYIICDGYVGSPLIPNEAESVQSFVNNCQISPPAGSLPIIDVAENHSANYPGYPAYAIKPSGADHVYFVCDGFLNSSAWCSYVAHSKAQKLLRAAESRFWEAGAKALIIDDKPVSYVSTVGTKPSEGLQPFLVKQVPIKAESKYTQSQPQQTSRNFIQQLPNADDGPKAKRLIIIGEDLKSLLHKLSKKP